MTRWSRKPELGEDLYGLALSAEEGFVLSRLDAPLAREEIATLTGLSLERVVQILSFLEDKGLIASDAPSLRPPIETIPDADFRDSSPALLDTIVGSDADEEEPTTTPFQPAPAVPDAMRAMLMSESLTDLFTLASHTDVPDETRDVARSVLLEKLASATADDRAALIVASEGAALAYGVALDARTSAILCARSYSSVVFVRNLARFPGCPAPLLGHLARQTLVKRDTQLRQLLLRHPNMPGDAKRRG